MPIYFEVKLKGNIIEAEHPIGTHNVLDATIFKFYKQIKVRGSFVLRVVFWVLMVFISIFLSKNRVIATMVWNNIYNFAPEYNLYGKTIIKILFLVTAGSLFWLAHRIALCIQLITTNVISGPHSTAPRDVILEVDKDLTRLCRPYWKMTTKLRHFIWFHEHPKITLINRLQLCKYNSFSLWRLGFWPSP